MILNRVSVLYVTVLPHNQFSDGGSVCQHNHLQSLHNGTVCCPAETPPRQECRLLEAEVLNLRNVVISETGRLDKRQRNKRAAYGQRGVASDRRKKHSHTLPMAHREPGGPHVPAMVLAKRYRRLATCV